MISIVVYGRNDSHGYNLHKRAALSLNCIAEVLTEENDEIIFVDYNTPDDLPTFIEAIRDTLTERCRRRLRVIRVRPAQHARFAGRTSYATIESVARNVGIRRSDPRNRWILSTNTDMVFVGREAGWSLSDLGKGLPDGFYQNPRLEVPESLWESLDRRDPSAAVEALRRWGSGLHLNELVHTDPVTRFDGIGDFQMVLRADFFAIHGFNEEMLAGWNVDMNLCHRLHRLRGGVESVFDRVLAYHCGHTRLPTAIHREDTVMNDPVRYIRGVTAPELDGQAGSWGLANETLEEFRADDPPTGRLPAVLEAVLPPMDRLHYESWNDFANFDAGFRLSIDAGHVLPYIMDLLVTAPPGSVLGYVGNHRDLFDLVLNAWRALGQWNDVLVPLGSVNERSGQERVDAVDDAELDRRASIFLFEFALDDKRLTREPYPCFDGLPEEARRRLGHVYGLFVQQTERERQRLCSGAPVGRRFIGVSVVNTFFGMRFSERVVFTRTMFSTRVRHGVVRAGGPVFRIDQQADSVGRCLAAALGRRFPIARQEVEMARSDLDHVLAADSAADIAPHRCSAVVLALLDAPDPAVPDPVREERRRWVEERRPSRAWRGRLTLAIATAARPDGAPALNKLCAAEDWEDARWLAAAEEFTREGLPFRSSTYVYFKRSRGVWERAQMVHGLNVLGRIGSGVRSAVVSDAPDGFGHFLSLRMGGVDVVDVGSAHAGGGGLPEQRPDTDLWLAKRRLYRADRLSIHHGGFQALARAADPWDAVVVPQNTLLSGGFDRTVDLLEALDRHLSVGGGVAWSIEIALDGQERDGCLTPSQAVDAAAFLSGECGLQPVGGFDWSISDATLDRVGVIDTGPVNRPHLVTQDDRGLRTCSVWVLRKWHSTPERLWRRVAEALHRKG
ncbi:hypothetical protein [Azospirillum tabaci]|uniref:hypothetical protein n=1 Tax=Azospirillum tabaci TaxID=2752310 RepID=UPI00166143C5|nr:hypothetical protein [Azospirillum tabaci]